MIRHNKPSTKFLQLTDLLYVLQVTLADVKPDKLKTRKKGTKKKKKKKENKKVKKKKKRKKKKKKKRKKTKKEENVMTTLVKTLLAIR